MVLSLKLCQFLEFPVLRQAFTFKPLFLFTIIVNYIYVSISGALVVLFLLAQGLRWFLFMFFFLFADMYDYLELCADIIFEEYFTEII